MEFIKFFLQTVNCLESLSKEPLSEYALTLIARGVLASIHKDEERTLFFDFCLEERTILI